MKVQPLKNVGMDMTVKPLGCPPSRANFIDGGENPSQQREILPINKIGAKGRANLTV